MFDPRDADILLGVVEVETEALASMITNIAGRIGICTTWNMTTVDGSC